MSINLLIVSNSKLRENFKQHNHSPQIKIAHQQKLKLMTVFMMRMRNIEQYFARIFQ